MLRMLGRVANKQPPRGASSCVVGWIGALATAGSSQKQRTAKSDHRDRRKPTREGGMVDSPTEARLEGTHGSWRVHPG